MRFRALDLYISTPSTWSFTGQREGKKRATDRYVALGTRAWAEQRVAIQRVSVSQNGRDETRMGGPLFPKPCPIIPKRVSASFSASQTDAYKRQVSVLTPESMVKT